MQFPLTSFTSVVREGNAHHCPAFINLVLANSAYSENNRVKGQWVIDGGIFNQEVVNIISVGHVHITHPPPPPPLPQHTHRIQVSENFEWYPQSFIIRKVL